MKDAQSGLVEAILITHQRSTVDHPALYLDGMVYSIYTLYLHINGLRHGSERVSLANPVQSPRSQHEFTSRIWPGLSTAFDSSASTDSRDRCLDTLQWVSGDTNCLRCETLQPSWPLRGQWASPPIVLPIRRGMVYQRPEGSARHTT